MADTENKYDDQDDEYPVADLLGDETVDEQILHLIGESKANPGDHFHDQYPNKKHPNGEPTFIEFKWNKDFKNMDQCDTIHMLYLLQCACELHRKRVIERNKYFESISRMDRYLSHVDTSQIITNFIEWHNMDREKNVFTGKMLKTTNKLFVINDIISRIGMPSIHCHYQ